MRDTGWSLIVPLKPLRRAKSRLAAVAGDALRPSLALAFAEDTVAAALASSAVRDVTVVTDDALAAERLGRLGARIVPDSPGLGLNAALAHGAEAVRGRRHSAALAALNADLPALRAAELTRVLAAAGGHARSFLGDAAGVGTTLLAAAPGAALAPAFEGASRARHLASGAVELTLDDVESVRRDVDTGEDLRAALALGVGRRTAVSARPLTAFAASGR
ncbi:2-phospho-L-lactate guanylyltransferase [Streptomyces sp. SBT349]|uniref:2-phospho-L-lactate guanylyltransferase n=1 Tax=Streptomyces sp. SBT349 TaxID=1580539 RepID=UPI00066E0383|nr:2-phospho-L-lactate guanylyltransferase [Streptomyces sp. SBT349]